MIHTQLKKVFNRKNSLDNLRNSVRSAKTERSIVSNHSNFERKNKKKIYE
jgi:hypothetical protein